LWSGEGLFIGIFEAQNLGGRKDTSAPRPETWGGGNRPCCPPPSPTPMPSRELGFSREVTAKNRRHEETRQFSGVCLNSASKFITKQLKAQNVKTILLHRSTRTSRGISVCRSPAVYTFKRRNSADTNVKTMGREKEKGPGWKGRAVLRDFTTYIFTPPTKLLLLWTYRCCC